MYPEDRVLVGVINTKRDLGFALNDGWYRIPQSQMPKGVYQEYIALFLSGKVFKSQSGTIAYYARRGGVELARRRDLIPKQADHARADRMYYRVAVEDVQPKVPPIRNESKRSISFIHTTWDRFVKATTIRELYSTADYYVDRIYHALKNPRVRIQRFWEADQRETGYAAGIRVLCQNGDVYASTDSDSDGMFLDVRLDEDVMITKIRAEIAKIDGPVMGPLGLDI
jgi:hypothetical protein